MPKAAKTKYYAVKLGREGPQIYNTWDEVSIAPYALESQLTLRSSARPT